MSTLGLIGSGDVGSTLARLAVAAGYDVVVSNRRGPESLAALVDELGPRARAGTPREAAASGDLVVVTIPLAAYSSVPVDELRGKVVIDTNNYYPGRDGSITELDAETTTTAEMLQAHLPESFVVKAFNNIYYPHLGTLARPKGAEDRSVLAIAGDDDGAKAAVTALIDDLGYDTLDAGALAEGWRFQRDTPAFTRPHFGDPSSPRVGRPVGEAELAEAIGEAKRYRDM